MTATVETKIWMALREHVDELDYAFLWPGEATELPQEDGQPVDCIEVSYLPNRPRRRALKGTSPHQRPGILQLLLLTVAGAEHHQTQAIEKAGTIAAHFEAGLKLHFDGVRVDITEAPTVSGGYQDTTRGRWATPITIRFQSFA